jgi:hypothetical protein
MVSDRNSIRSALFTSMPKRAPVSLIKFFRDQCRLAALPGTYHRHSRKHSQQVMYFMGEKPFFILSSRRKMLPGNPCTFSRF